MSNAQPPTVLFICYGNVCRSQMAQGWYNHYTQSSQSCSAGTNPLAAHLFSHPTPESIQVMAEEGIDISDQPVRALTPDMAAQAERVVVLCQPQDCPDYLQQHPTVVYREIEDPFGKNLDEYRSAREQIRLVVEDLLPPLPQP
jgi:protein-tyrosine-phosphatase